MNGFSIIVCCYNATRRISKTLEYLVKLKTSNFNFEVIIIDNNSTDETWIKLKNLSHNYNQIDISIYQEILPGKTNALILGLKVSKFEFVLVCDDDNLLDEDYLLNAHEILLQDKSIGVLGGRGFIANDIQVPDWFNNVELAYAVGAQAPTIGNITKIKGHVWGAGMIFRREAWDKVIELGFTTFLTGRKGQSVAMTGEDTEMCLLIQNAGYNIFYSDLLKFTHVIPENKFIWEYYKDLCKGFARSQVILENYKFYFNTSEEIKFSKYWQTTFRQDLKNFFHGWKSLNFYKSIFIEFILKREGYFYGFQKRKSYDRLISMILLRQSLKNVRKQIAKIKKVNRVFIN